MHPELAERVLGRLGLSTQPNVDFAGLSETYRAWCANVPFDNLTKRIHLALGSDSEFPNLAPEAFFEDYLTHGAGGTCWPSSLALYSLLEHIGFTVWLGVGAMYRDAPNTMESHGTVLVDIGADRYWVDTAMATVEPLAFREGGSAGPAWRVTRVVRRDGAYAVLWPGIGFPGEMGCCFLDDNGSAIRYRGRYEASREMSPFNTHLMANRTTADRQLTFMLGCRVEHTEAGYARSEPLAPVERARLLVDEFGYSEELVSRLPPDDPGV